MNVLVYTKVSRLSDDTRNPNNMAINFHIVISIINLTHNIEVKVSADITGF